MSNLDLIVLFGTLIFIVVYGVWKTRGSRDLEGYLRGDNQMKWGTIGLSVMATQASAITFLSTPGQAYESGMAFVQNYIGQPIALVIVAAVFIPIYYKLKVFTAYEFLEKRFDFKTRMMGAGLFLVQRGMQAGITIYAPAIILSAVLGWDLNLTIMMVGMLVIIYTVSGGSRAVSLTQKHQMTIILIGMFAVFFALVAYLPDFLSFPDAVRLAGKMGKLEAMDFSLDFSKRYTFWSGMTGGLFLALSYFGTDQSQVARYLSGKNVTESRLGMIFNALFKVPLQFFILFVGVMVYIFYQFQEPPVVFRQNLIQEIRVSEYGEEMRDLESRYSQTFALKSTEMERMVGFMNEGDQDQIDTSQERIEAFDRRGTEIRYQVKDLMRKHDPDAETQDSDYVFLTFIMTYLPKGLIGLLVAVIFSAAMSSTSSELNALGSTSTVDFYKRIIKKEASDEHYVMMSKMLTALWGLLAILFALFAYLVENLIEAINIVASLFYGTILGIFLVAFFVKFVKGNAVFVAAILAELMVLVCHLLTGMGLLNIAYLWYNVIGCLLVIMIAAGLQKLNPNWN